MSLFFLPRFLLRAGRTYLGEDARDPTVAAQGTKCGEGKVNMVVKYSLLQSRFKRLFENKGSESKTETLFDASSGLRYQIEFNEMLDIKRSIAFIG